MQRLALPAIDPYSLGYAVDATSYARGVEYLRQRAVLEVWWDAEDGTLNGLIRGSNNRVYTTTAYFSEARAAGTPLSFAQGACSCPVSLNCKHAVALVLAATTGMPGTRPAAPGGGQPVKASRPAWERSLDGLLRSPAAAATAQPGGTTLAIELTLTSAGYYYGRGAAARASQPRLAARLVRPGKNGWIAGSLSWSKLDSLRYSQEGYPAGQVRLLHELYALYRAGTSDYGYYSYGDERSIDLGAFESRQLWPLLDEAHSIGLRLVHGGKLGDVAKYGEAELCLDITSTGQGSTGQGSTGPAGQIVITTRLSAGQPAGTARADATPILFIGTQGHGVVYPPGGSRPGGNPLAGRFLLARLAQGVPEQLQLMALAGQRLEVPAAELARFRDTYYPRLRRTATVISSDGTFVPPEVSGPTLVLTAGYGAGHDLRLHWDWAYQVGDSLLRAAAGQPGFAAPDQPVAAYRDPEAERALLASLDHLMTRGGDVARAALSGPVTLSGIDTMRFSTEVLPLLASTEGVAVEITGEPADYREASDSVRISVSAEQAGADTDWFDLGITITVAGHAVPFTDVFVALSHGESHLLLSDGAYFSLDKPELRALTKLIEEARALQDAPAGPLKISKFQAGLWAELAELGVVSHQARAWQQQVETLASISSVEPRDPPATLLATLRPYQLDGFGWLAFLWEHGLGGILADDMGLGKTLQTLALICHAKQASHTKQASHAKQASHTGQASPPFLIVAPTSVVPNWAAEASRFAPGLNVVTLSDTIARRGTSLDRLVAGADAVVTSYTLLRLDFPDYEALSWSGLILDEAQFTKNHQSKIYQCARRLPAPFKLAITGTPMENNLMELWSLLSITAPGLFPNPARFRDYYARPIEKQDNPELLAQLRRRIKPLVKRRTKEQVAADLPPKQEQVIEVELHPRHRKLYQTQLQRERQKVLGLIHDMNANRFTILRSLTLLRQLSLHAGLVDEQYGEIPSSKIDVLVDQLRDVIGGGHRALVFSQFTGFLGRVRERLATEGVRYCYLDGSTRNRAELITSFKNGHAPVFLISLKAGGFGLNLTEADYCFLLDPWWNPATEAQAVDRTHRIGQSRNVMVYRLIASGTIEEKVMALKARKAEIFASVMDDGNAFGASLDADDIRGLFA